MKVNLVRNQYGGLSGAFNSDLDIIKGLKKDEIFEVDIKPQKNAKFHKKYYALLNFAFFNLPEEYESVFTSEEHFRSVIQVQAGHCDFFYTLDKEPELIRKPKSISFDVMDEIQFARLYKDIYDVIYGKIFKGCPPKNIEKKLIDFM